MANLDIRTPRFYVDYINFLKNRDQAGGHYGISTSTDQINVVSGNNIAELYDMRPLNQVEFNTTGDANGHVNLWFDLKTSGFNIDFVAILNHNMHKADAKVRISASETLSEVQAVDHASADDTEGNMTLTSVIGTHQIQNNKASSDDESSWGTGHTIVKFPESTHRYWGIQFEGTSGQTSVGHGDGDFDGSTNLKIGCILLGQYYDMPRTPDLSVKRSIDFDGVSVQESIGGQRFSTMTQHGRQNIEATNKSPFHTYYNSFGAYGGRMSYDMKFSYLNSTDIMPDNYNQFQNSDEGIIEDLWNKTNGRLIPFIFTQDGASSSYSDYLFARFAQDSLNMTQVAPDVFDISMRIEEEF
tara:strand:+ start:10240 stop:11307 length:1068 start_codon:yes stop_codon:yes gene_type:complete